MRGGVLTWSVESPLDSRIAADLRATWERDAGRNPFAAPAFLDAMATHATGAGDTPLFTIGRASEGAAHAAWALRTDRSGVLHLLPHAYSDQRTCLADPAASVGDLAAGFAHAVGAAAPSAVVLTNVPSWGSTLDAAREGLRQLGWSFRAFPAWPCPLLRVAPGPQAAAALRGEINRHRRVREYTNRLAREPGYGFEILENGDGLDAWCDEFCDAHEWRWNATATPSTYRSADVRALFRSVLAAWSREGLLVRFGIRLAGGRAAFVAALRSGTRLIYHHVATSPAAESLRAGHVLIRLMGLWMAERGFDTLDFGAGGEAYKARYATDTEALWRLYAAPRRLSRWYLRGVAEERIRSVPALQRAWDRWVNVRWATWRRALDVRRWRGALRRVRDAVVPRRQTCYSAWGLGAAAAPPVTELRTFTALATLERERAVPAAERAAVYARRAGGARPFGIMADGRVGRLAWLGSLDPDVLPAWGRRDARAVWQISAWAGMRGNRQGPLLRDAFRGILGTVGRDEVVILLADAADGEAHREAAAAGFKPFATCVTRRGTAVFEALA